MTEVLGALGAGALLVAIARQMGFSASRGYAMVAVFPILVGAFIGLPNLWEAGKKLDDQRGEFAHLSAPEAQIQVGTAMGMNVGFFGWAQSRMKPDETFHLEIGVAPEEVKIQGVGTRQASILQWGLFQMAPNIAFEQSPKARDIKPGEGRDADWIVFYEFDPANFSAPLGKVETFEPGFAIARTDRAG